MAYRLHLFGASGSGTTTLGQALAQRLAIAHFDADNFFWCPSEQPFSLRRLRDERIQLLQQQVAGLDSWVLSGSLCGWGDPMIPAFTHAIFLRLDPEIRLQRLRVREFQRYGEQIHEGGERHLATQTFLAWAAGYDTGGQGTRSLRRHESWITGLSCPVIRLDATHRSVQALQEEVLRALDHSIMA
ncbi:AAA family ATPase [Pseudomonas chlororaphis]|uniref:AAA family ATPase n=1 Tax=Pseudomonas chlororaphis TaxID=587753 RepID=UPI00046FBADE|nr:AAA family ATPase [Pseudomonas chlororaphis]